MIERNKTLMIMEIKDLRQRENDPDLPTHVWWEVPPFLKILFLSFSNFNQGSSGRRRPPRPGSWKPLFPSLKSPRTS